MKELVVQYRKFYSSPLVVVVFQLLRFFWGFLGFFFFATVGIVIVTEQIIHIYTLLKKERKKERKKETNKRLIKEGGICLENRRFRHTIA